MLKLWVSNSGQKMKTDFATTRTTAGNMKEWELWLYIVMNHIVLPGKKTIDEHIKY